MCATGSASACLDAAIKNMKRTIALLSMFIILLLAGCSQEICSQTNRLTPDAPIAVSSPYLQAALGEVLERPPRLVPLTNPGMCPGHFDMRPSQLHDLSQCGRLVRFDFQRSLDARFGRQWEGPTQKIVVRLRGGLCVPESYISACRQIANALVIDGMLDRQKADQRLARLERRMAKFEKEILQRIDAARLRGEPVLCSSHQADFCRWLGLRVVADSWSADVAAASQFEKSAKKAASSKIKMIVANEPEGRQAADALAERLGARVVVFANFPTLDPPHPFDAMVKRNLISLLNL